MSLPAWTDTLLSRAHDREGFDCGEPALNEFLQRHARQSGERGASRTFVACPVDEPGRILGYYSLSPASIHYARTPVIVRKGLARFEVPAFRLARLAVDTSVQGKGMGGDLLLAAGRRCIMAAAQVGGVALLIDAKNQRTADWYASFGAVALLDTPLSLVLPLSLVAATLEQAGKT